MNLRSSLFVLLSAAASISCHRRCAGKKSRVLSAGHGGRGGDQDSLCSQSAQWTDCGTAGPHISVLGPTTSPPPLQHAFIIGGD